MDDRARRIGENEAVFRAVNEEIESLSLNFAAISGETIHIVCECGDIGCFEQLAVPLRQYERIRAEPTAFITLPGHEKPDVETVVETTDTYYVVRKHEGGPAEAARATDPREG